MKYLSNLAADAVYAIRQFSHARAFTAAAVLTLALGIGGTTAIFSLMNDVMLRSLPVAEPASLYRIGGGYSCCVQGGPQDDWGMFSYPLFEKLRAAAPEFEEVTAFQATTWRMSVLRPSVDEVPRPLRSEFVTGNYFQVFGIKPFAGRLFEKADDSASAAPVVVLSYAAWQEHFGGDGGVIGAPLAVQGQSFTVAGVAPPGFFGDTLRANPPEIWIPLQQEPLISGSDSLLRQPVSAWLRAIGRLKPGATTEGVTPRLTELLRRWLVTESGYPPNWMPEIRKVVPQQHVRVVPAGNGVDVMRDDYGRSLQILLAVCGMVLLIACANVANLLLARGMARRVQTSIRLAMGASRGVLIRQALVESTILAVAGGAAGLLVAYAAETALIALAFPEAGAHMPFSTTPSLPVLAFAFGLSVITGVVFGAGPAWFAARRDPVEALRGAGRSTRDHSTVARKALLVVQAALSVVLVAGSALLARSLSNLQSQDLGFRTDGLTLVSLNAPPSTYTPERLDALYRGMQDRLSTLPGVERAALALYAPLTDNWGELIYVDGNPPAELSEKFAASWDRVSAGYFETVGQPVVRGRSFTAGDNRNTENVAVVNEAFAARFFPNKDALDGRFGIDLPQYSKTWRVVGVVKDAKYTNPTRPARPMFFVPLAQWVNYDVELIRKIESRSHFIGAALLRTNLPPAALEPALRKTLAEVDSNVTLINVRSMRQQLALVFDQQRAVAGLAGLFGAVALLLAAVGLYGVTAYSVAQRTSEIGVRMALGADSRGVVRLVLKGAFRMVAIGLALGLPLAVGAGQLLSGQLYGVDIWDPPALTAAVVALGIAAFLAAVIPALRAAAIDPMKALRTE
ncbi:MAG: ABC transporter permease [Bryobacteraceae bacterium]|nr:ABC transporter permease [Bryobacteraceae bacterium]